MRRLKIYLPMLIIFTFLSCQKMTGPVEVHSEKIIFVKDCNDEQNLFSMDSDGSHIRQLTFDGKASLPVTLPGKPIIFYNSSGDIFRMNNDGSGKINLTHSASTEYEFAVSPGGGKIAFVSVLTEPPDGSFHSEIFLVHSDGTHIRRLTFSKYYSESPAFSADGLSIAYVSLYNYDPPKFAIHIYSLIDSTDSKLKLKGTSQINPLFSPDGKWLSYYSRDDHNLYLFNLKNGEQIKVAPAWHQNFSNDGKFLFFLKEGVDNRPDIFRYRIKDGLLRNLTNSKMEEKAFSLNRDDTKLIFWAYPNPKGSTGAHIFLMNLQTNQFVQLTDNNCSNTAPAFVSGN